MTWVHTSDGVTVSRRFRDRPAKHWVQDDAETGHYVEVTDGNANSLGYYLLEVDPQPSPDHVRDGQGGIDGSVWRVSWVFDQATADANAAEAADEAERQQARGKLADLQAFIDDPNVTQAEAVAELKEHARILKRLIRDVFGA